MNLPRRCAVVLVLPIALACRAPTVSREAAASSSATAAASAPADSPSPPSPSASQAPPPPPAAGWEAIPPLDPFELPRAPSDGLDGAAIQRVRAQLSSAVVKACWGKHGERTRREPGAPPSVSLRVVVTIAETGAVSSAYAQKAPFFPDLAECVSRQVRSWRFPRSSGAVRAGMPFFFAGVP